MLSRQRSNGVDKTPNLHPVRGATSKSQWTVAAPCTSEQFKTKDHRQKPLAQDWTDYLSSGSRNQGGSTLKNAFKHLKNPNVISLGGGLPLSDYFPFESLSMTVPSPGMLERDAQGSSGRENIMCSSKNDLAQDRSIYDLSVALNYSQGSGSAQLLRWITEHTEIVHDPPYANWQCTMTIGNTSALDMALRIFTEPGDYVLSDEYTFATAVETAKPMGVNFIGVKMDKEGLLPDSLREILSGWDSTTDNSSRRPFLLYLIPTGQNPTGATQSIERRLAIYQVAEEYNLIILEDDPYFFLQLDIYNPTESFDLTIQEPQPPKAILEMIVPSYLSIDTDGRVVRMDSFSKVIGPGLRLGWLSAPQQIIDQYKGKADVSTQGPAGLSQLALFKLLDEEWGHSGYFQWLEHIRQEYTDRRNFMIRACERYLPRSITSWEPAQGGMFQWIAVDWTKHPDAKAKSALEIEEEIWMKGVSNGTLVACGSWFRATAGPCKEIFFRTTFAAAQKSKVEEAVMRFGNALRECFNISD